MYFNEKSAHQAVSYFAKALKEPGVGDNLGLALGRAVTAFVPEKILTHFGDKLSKEVDNALKAVHPDGPKKLREFTRALGL